MAYADPIACVDLMACADPTTCVGPMTCAGHARRSDPMILRVGGSSTDKIYLSFFREYKCLRESSFAELKDGKIVSYMGGSESLRSRGGVWLAMPGFFLEVSRVALEVFGITCQVSGGNDAAHEPSRSIRRKFLNPNLY